MEVFIDRLVYSTNFGFTAFSAPLYQAALLEGARESATRLLNTASQTTSLQTKQDCVRKPWCMASMSGW
jgi:hypothetical protein